MARGLFVVGFTVQEVLQIQQKAKEMLLEGKTVMSWTDSGTTSTSQLAMPVQDVLEECAYALQKLAPNTYGEFVTVLQGQSLGCMAK
jgi:hypothetical protein